MDLHKPCLLDCRIDGETLKSIASHWPPQRWQEYEPLFTYCRDNGVRIVACGTLLEEIMQHRLDFIETQDVVETTLALNNYSKACDCGQGAVFFSVAR
ncbi:uncharacterized protein LOC114298624 isoform X2 [Camellia sinensis]|uniref:uncharacterized protein LOC114298624 isoform X2 n=1 Tax=Camellia sinensis TaxID=4442 RepID=UPI001035740F|nr:uncharacterized protein LOC114298624 isoform X2 [Camellia sinensis]